MQKKPFSSREESKWWALRIFYYIFYGNTIWLLAMGAERMVQSVLPCVTQRDARAAPWPIRSKKNDPSLQTSDVFYWYHNYRLVIKSHKVAIFAGKSHFLRK